MILFQEENNLVEIASKQLTLDTTQANLHIKMNLLESLKQQNNLGNTTLNEYQFKINMLNDMIWRYTNSTDPIRIDGLPHLDTSLG